MSDNELLIEGRGGEGRPISNSFLLLLYGPSSPPPPGHRWFEFNDTHVGPVVVKSIEKMFQGKQSAYMLFYRKKTLHRPNEGQLLIIRHLGYILVLVCMHADIHTLYM